MMLQVSSAKVVEILPDVDSWNFIDNCEILGTPCQVLVLEARRKKCPRCWKYTADVEGDVCVRCTDALDAWSE